MKDIKLYTYGGRYPRLVIKFKDIRIDTKTAPYSKKFFDIYKHEIIRKLKWYRQGWTFDEFLRRNKKHLKTMIKMVVDELATRKRLELFSDKKISAEEFFDKKYPNRVKPRASIKKKRAKEKQHANLITLSFELYDKNLTKS